MVAPLPRGRSHRTAWLLAMLLAISSTVAVTGPVMGGVDPPPAEHCEAWSAFSRVEPTARDVVLVRVTEATDGVATGARVDDVLRGSSPSSWKLDSLDPGTPHGQTCDGPFPIYAEEGDRLVLAIDGRLPERAGPVDTVALVTLEPRQPDRSGLERLTPEQADAIDDEPLPTPAPRPTQGPPPESWLEQVAGFGRDLLRPWAGSISDLAQVPWPERTPAPLPEGAIALELWVQEPAGTHRIGEGAACMQALWGGSLRVRDGVLEAVDGEPVLWPRGFSARQVDGVGELVRPDGTVVAREGEYLEAGGGSIGDSGFLVCSVGEEHYSPAS